MQTWTVGDRSFSWGDRTYLMGVLNVTPDSFSDGGCFESVAAAIGQAHALRQQGVDILDIGGESTRPTATPVSLDCELQRVLPVIQALRQDPLFDSIPISIDTTKAAVAAAAIQAGANWVNDISGATLDATMLSTVAQLQVPIFLMHLRGTPQTMQQFTDYEDLVGEIIIFFQTQIAKAIVAGITKEHIGIDPGIGFAKTAEQNVELLKRLAEFKILGHPLLIGTSRKSFIGKLLNQPDAKKRVWGTAATCCAAIAQGVDILRVHDVAEMYDVAQVADAIWRS
jgi:dihydropteroate synthase